MALKNKIWRIIDIINWSKDYLEKNNIDSPRLTIELMLTHVLEIERIKLYTDYDKPLSDKELSTIKSMINQRVKRIPLQYILGQVEFLGRKFIVNQNVLIPRPETEEIVVKVINDNKKNKDYKILDIGTGSGCIAISLAKEFTSSTITALDNSTSALKVAKQNSIDLEVDNVKFVYADILTTEPKLKYDIIVSNPPYVSTSEMNEIEPELSFEPNSALTDSSDGLEFYRRFVTIYRNILSIDGVFYLELNSYLAEEIKNMFSKDYRVELINDLFDKPRILRGRLS
ncbi:MAG: peptide chain release factor N(5)-glutamine methyltransferase [Candidatus Kapaibacterium sp.]